MNWTLKTFDKSVSQDWDAFISQQPDGSIHQCTTWKALQEKIPGREQVLGFYALDENQNWMAATWCVKMSTGFANTHWYYSARGPVAKPTNAQFRAEFLAAVSQELKQAQGLFWRLDPFWQESDWAPIKLLKKRAIKPATKNFQPTDALMLDLTLSEEALKAQMHRQGRKALRLADKAEVKTEIIPSETVTDEHLNTWQQLNEDTTARDGFFGHDKTYYKNFIKSLNQHAYLCFATHQQKTIAAAILTIHHGKAIYYFGASSSDKTTRDLRAPYALQWAMILFAKNQGATTYDFTGITPENQPDHPYKGITQFKTRFGGYRATYASGKEIVLNSWWYAIYRLIKTVKP